MIFSNLTKSTCADQVFFSRADVTENVLKRDRKSIIVRHFYASISSISRDDKSKEKQNK